MAIIVWATDYDDPYFLVVSGGKWLKYRKMTMITNESTWLYSDGKYGTSVPSGQEGTVKFKLATEEESHDMNNGFTPYTRSAGQGGTYRATRAGDMNYQSTQAEIEWVINELNEEG